ncbi:MAG: ATP-binding cassette domain-containing protein [Alphaproteobacteria bacterium]|nr:ATP-binding cassette domain-containing protein [Alphaproteobacteria bacterium]
MIELRDLRKSFGDLVVLDGVSLRFELGHTTAIIGPSGTGKSVLLKHLVGLMRPDSGQVMCFGTDMAIATEREMFAVRRRFGMLFQEGALFDSMSVGENVEFPLVHHHKQLSAAERRDRVDEVLEQVGLPGFYDRIPGRLSGGQRKRVGLARAIVGKPEVVLFDEPNSGLDPMTSNSIDALICEMKEALGITFIVISHDIVGVLNVADYVGMLYGGHLVEYGTCDDLVRSDQPIVRQFLRRNVALPERAGEVVRLPAYSG